MHVHWGTGELFEMLLSRKSLQACYKLLVMVYLMEVGLLREEDVGGRKPVMVAHTQKVLLSQLWLGKP